MTKNQKMNTRAKKSTSNVPKKREKLINVKHALFIENPKIVEDRLENVSPLILELIREYSTHKPAFIKELVALMKSHDVGVHPEYVKDIIASLNSGRSRQADMFLSHWINLDGIEFFCDLYQTPEDFTRAVVLAEVDFLKVRMSSLVYIPAEELQDVVELFASIRRLFLPKSLREGIEDFRKTMITLLSREFNVDLNFLNTDSTIWGVNESLNKTNI